ncbi:GGDEF domain-containing protein [Thalassotalea piscium]
MGSAINARLELEKDLELQSSTFVQFINKLSQIAKGIDVQLDNKLASLRKALSKSLSWQEAEKLINEISQLLQNHSIKNDNNIKHLHEQFLQAGKVLQQIKNLPDSLRRELRGLITETKDKKDSVVQYVKPLTLLVEYYQAALQAKEDWFAGKSDGESTDTSNQSAKVDDIFIKRFISFLSNLNVSSPYKVQIDKIKSDLSTSISHKDLLDDFLEVFEIINKDLANERTTAKVFLSTLSTTLSSVQTAVERTININEISSSKHNELNSKLTLNLSEMSQQLKSANSLVELKVDINDKLKQITMSLEEKSALELAQFNDMRKRLTLMQEKVNTLELQGQVFAKKIKEQQAKSYQDSLTKLDNRASFDDCFSKQIVRFHHSPFELAIVVMDLDDFKRINDTYGHIAGDKTLQVIANTLAKSVTKNEFVGRYGGEEFVMIFSGFNKQDLVKKLNQIRLNVAKLPFKFRNNNVTMTLSIGATHITTNDNVHTAFERADTALYKAKENGKNQIIYA